MTRCFCIIAAGMFALIFASCRTIEQGEEPMPSVDAEGSALIHSGTTYE